ncbi:hybrid sensor histidine kinase/response regulator [Thermodesulfatator autotrophicus]|uniref:histidine kinase n=1 Tax=Thermodesulfatator autotrophicus TaxID=1795632 RepID=A0A177E657_9BACT|nr:response regulator [Thermodesulfatator autotrophicus]OAG27437.1 hypothetical protein TH606_06755 [Thermodesulfatator autotrophicus]
MEKSFKLIPQIKKFLRILIGREPSYQVTRSFAIMMLPLTFIAGLFICFSLPISYYYFSKQEKSSQAELHAKYLSSIFRDTIERYPLTWEERIKEKLKIINAKCVTFYDPKERIIAIIGQKPTSFWERKSATQVKYPIYFNGNLYGSIEIILLTENLWSNLFKILAISLVLGTAEGLALWLIPAFYILRDEEKINKSREELFKERERLRLSETKYRTLFEFSPDAFTVSTLEGNIIHFNNRFVKMFKLEDNNIPQKLNDKFFFTNPSDREKIIDELLKEGEIRNKEVLLRRVNGEEFYALISMRLIGASIFKDKVPVELENSYVFIFTAIRDISKLKEMERQLLQAQKLESIGLLAGGIAHDFNNILAIISGHNELLKRSLKDEKAMNYLEVIDKSVKRASELVNNLLAFARAGKYKIEPIDLNILIKDFQSLLRHSLDKRIIVKFDLFPNLPSILADPSQITQVVMNLCINARDALLQKGGGRLIIKTYSQKVKKEILTITGDRIPPGSYVVLEVKDNGPGIPPEFINKIFEPFFTTKPIGEGTGLGLSVVYGIIRNHDGYIDVKSRPGDTRFLIYLPEAKETKLSPKVVTKPQAAPKINGTATVLVVDDEEEIRRFIRSTLEEHGYRVIEASNGYEALEIFQNKKDEINLVLLDLIMPEMEGKDTFEALKKLSPNLKVIILTGYVADRVVRSMLKNGAKAFLTKPFRLQDLLIVVHQVLSTSK